MKFLGDPRSGSQAATTSSRNRYGQYTRNRATPVNPASVKQGVVRTRLSTASRAWAGISAGDRAGWEAWAYAHPVTDSLGQSIILSGSAWFIKARLSALAAGLTPSSSAPVEPTPYAWDGTVTATAPGTLDLAWTAGVVPAGTAVIVQAGPPTSAGVNFGTQYRQIAVLPPADATPSSVGTPYAAIWGSLTAGQVVFFRFQVVYPGGVPGPYTYARVLVA